MSAALTAAVFFLLTARIRGKALAASDRAAITNPNSVGAHVDDAIIGGRRTDVSFTLFLSDPKATKAANWFRRAAAGEDATKLAAGSLVAYPSTALHRVNDVTRGERLAAVGWARSFIRDPCAARAAVRPRYGTPPLFAREGKSADST